MPVVVCDDGMSYLYSTRYVPGTGVLIFFITPDIRKYGTTRCTQVQTNQTERLGWVLGWVRLNLSSRKNNEQTATRLNVHHGIRSTHPTDADSKHAERKSKFVVRTIILFTILLHLSLFRQQQKPTTNNQQHNA
jgi:hypothetical protein